MSTETKCNGNEKKKKNKTKKTKTLYPVKNNIKT